MSPGGSDETTGSACVYASAFKDKLAIGNVDVIWTEPVKF